MARVSKRLRVIRDQVDVDKAHTFEEATQLLAKLSTVKFKESIDLAVSLGVDPRRSDQAIRGAVVLPNGTGKTKKVAVFVTGADEQAAAKEAGADIVGDDDLLEKIQKGELGFDVLITTPVDMPKLARYGQILGPRGLMPNPKVGTVTTQLSVAVANVKKGQVTFRADRYGIVHARVGDVTFTPENIAQNLSAFFAEIRSLKPSSQKGTYLKKAVLSTTMGPGLHLDLSSLV